MDEFTGDNADINAVKAKRNAASDTSIEFTPNNPFTVDIPNETISDNIAYPGLPIKPESAGFFESAKEEFKEQSSNIHALHYLNLNPPEKPNAVAQYILPDVGNMFAYKAPPPGWTPKEEIEKQTNVDPKYMPLLLEARNPQDFQLRLNDIQDQEHHDQVLQNGNFMGKIIGGLIGWTPIGSIESFIPLATIATKAKIGVGFLSGMMKSAPSMLAAGAMREGAMEMDKTDRNLPDFLMNTFVDTAFGTVFFGAVGAAKSFINLSEFNRLKQFAKDSLEGVDFNFKVDKEGNLKGFEAFDATGGSLSAAKVTRAQEHADAAFYKGGLYKVPYVGTAAANILSGNLGNLPIIKEVPILRNSLNYLFGSPLIQLKTSDYKAANAFADAAFDHFITTEGEAKGGTRPPSFELKMKQTKALITSLNVQTNALYAERNGYVTQARPTIGIQNAWSAMKQKYIEAISKQTKSTDWVNKETFMDEIQQVMTTGKSSEHAAVNEAAAMYRKIKTDTAKAYLKAHNLPDDYFRNMDTYLTRVFDTKYMNENEGIIDSKSMNENDIKKDGWIPVISSYLKKADDLITQRMQPIHDLESQIKEFETAQKEAVKELGKRESLMNTGTKIVPNAIGNENVKKLANMREQLKSMKENLQNELRSNPDLDYHVDDRFALSADEAKELKSIQEPVNKIKKEIESQKAVVADLKAKRSRQLSSAKKAETVDKAKPKAQKYVITDEEVAKAEEELNKLNRNLEDENYRLYDMTRNGKINPRLYNPLTHEFRDLDNRLKFRDVFNSDIERETQAQAYYNSIMHTHPEDLVNDMFNMMVGNPVTNPILKRTMPIPDEVLYNNNFMTKDLHSKTANYVNLLAKKTHLKTSFENVTVNGNFEELASDLLTEYKDRREKINQRIEKTTNKKEIAKQKKLLNKEAVKFNEIKTTMKKLFENRMMGINKREDFDTMVRRSWMSLTAATNLHNLAATQITDLAFGGFQHGIWPQVRDSIYPIISSLGGILKTKDSEALRKMAPSIHLGYQDVGNNYADRNWHSELQPYMNMGKIVSGIEKYAHFSALTDLSPYIDNGVQHAHGSVIQANFMRHLHEYVNGTLSEIDSLYLRKYGIDPKVWGERMVNAYNDAKGFKTALGGYVSKAWQWQDLEAANVFNQAVFRGIQNTLVWKGMADSPFFADNILGLFFHTFTGWGYAATNRYLIPSLQHPDASLLIKTLWMAGAGALVSPMRRIARGEQPWPDDMTATQIAYEAFSDSGLFSTIANVLNIANFLSSDKLLGDLKNDKFRNRARTGIFGMSDIVSSTASRIADVIGMANSGINEKDLKTAAHMLAITGAMYGHYISDKLIESWNLPRNKRATQ